MIFIQNFLILIWPVLKIILEILVLVISLLLIAAYYVYVERKVLAWIMLRKGPNVVGSFGLLQPIADGIKLITKEIIIPLGANKILFLIAPLITFVCSLLSWAVIPFNYGWVIANINVGVLYIFAISSLGVYGIIIAGWSSNSRYAFLGSLRAAAQMISYEVSMGFVLVTVLLCAGSLNLTNIILSQKHFWFFIPLFPMFIVFFISALAETNRTPFDLPEAEAELVAGYIVEYSSSIFLLFMVGEYINMILMSALISILFFGGWLSPAHCLDCIPGFIWFLIKTSIFMFIFIWVRGTLPRYRYDQLMRLGWKVFLPLSLIWLCIIASFIYSTGFSFN